MKLSWFFLILLLVFVAVFSVQNAEPITVHFLAWELTMSAALVIQLSALLGALVGLTASAWSRRRRPTTIEETPAEASPALDHTAPAPTAPRSF